MDVKEIAASIARDIREWGHYQQQPGQVIWHGRNGACCIYCNPTFQPHMLAADVRNGRREPSMTDESNFIFALAKTIGTHDVIGWSNRTPTNLVLETLDKIAASE